MNSLFQRHAWTVGWCVTLLLSSWNLRAAEVIPPAPKAYFNDYAGVVSAGTAASLNQALETFEKESSSQILVAIFPHMQSESSVEDYTVRVAQSWKVGQKGKDNGAVLFVFVQDRKVYMQVGYGLEAVLPDITVKQIIDNEITPRFRNGDYDAGLRAGVTAIMAAARGEYKGTGRTVAGGRSGAGRKTAGIIPMIFFVAVLLALLLGRGRRRSGLGWGLAGWMLGGGGFSGGGGWGSGGGGNWGGGGGGGFSGGGGSFGGGGAGGSW